jgi:DNA polymerase-1
MSKQLATIRIEDDIEMKLEDFKVTAADDAALLSKLRELELFSLIKRLSPVESKEYTLSNIDDFLATAKHEVSIVLHDPYLSLANENGQAFVFEGETSKLSKAIENAEITKIALDSKELFKGFDVHGKVFDLGLAAYLLRPGRREYSLSSLSIEWLGRPLESLDSEETVVNSMGERAEASHALKEALDEELEEKGLHSLFSDLEVPLARVLAGMEKKGVLIDTEYFERESKTLHSKLAEIEEEIYRDAGESFNLRSPAQLGHILFDKLGLPHKKRKKTGYSTDQSVLTELAKTHELPGKILSYRELHKLKSTYIDAIPLLADDGNRVHTIWHQTTTSTGRLSSSNPNLQNIPRQETRKGFISPEGWVILSADYSQIELRILASVSGDGALRDAFREGKDVHARTASLIFGIPESEVTKEERRKAKAVNFGIVYGMGPYGLSQRLKIGVEEANRFIQSYFATYPEVKKWIDAELDFARKNGYVETLMGRKRWSQGVNSDNARIREAEERAIINAPIQGSAADMIKVAMIRIYEKLKGFNSQLIMQVHDELVLEAPEEEIEEIRELVKREMEKALPLEVPIVVDIGVGKNWDEAH